MIDTVLQAIAEPRRRAILQLIRETELSAGEIAAHFAVSRPAISQHLQVLADAGLVTVRRDGTRRMYLARAAGLADLRAFLETFWDERLLRLQQAAEAEQRRLDAMTEQQTDALVREIRIAAQPETVFAFFVDPDKMMQWMGQAVALDPRPGGICRIDMNGHDIARGEYLEIVPHSRVVFTWGWETEGYTPRPGGSTVEISLTAERGGTLVLLRHLGLTPEERTNHGIGWDQFLPHLVAVAEGRQAGTGRPGME